MASSSGSLYRLFRNSATRIAASSPSSVPKKLPTVRGSSPMRRSDKEADEAAASIFSELDPELLVSRFKEASGVNRFRAKHRVYEFAVRRLASAGRHAGVAEILEEQKRYASDIAREGFAARLISLYGIAGMAEAAEETFLQLPSFGCSRTSLSFNALLSACSTAGDFQRVDDLFKSVPQQNPEIVPNEISYNILISSRCKRGDLEEALTLLEIMQEKGNEPNLITFNTLLNGFYLQGRFSEAEKIWETMTQKKCNPDVKSFNAKVRGMVMAGRMEEAVELVEKFPSLGFNPETSTFNSLIKGYCVAGEMEHARKLFDDLPNKGCRPNKESFETMVGKLLEEGDIELALSLCKESISRRYAVNGEMIKDVAEALVRSSRDLDAEKLLKLAGLEVLKG